MTHAIPPVWSRYASDPRSDTPATQAIAQLTQAAGAHGLSARDLNELAAISAEPNSEMQGEELLTFAGRLEQSGNLGAAVLSYAALSRLDGSPVAERARERMAAVTGEGNSGGGRAEFVFRRLAVETCNPSVIAAMGVAGAGFRAVRFTVAARLAVSPTANFITRGIGRQIVSFGVGTLVEAPLFSLSSRAVSTAFNPAASHASLGDEILGGYALLGSLRLAGAASTGLHRVFGGGAGLSQSLFRQGGMLAGIYGSRWLDQWAGLSRPATGDSRFWDSLALLVQFNAAGRLTQNLFGARFAAWERRIDAQTESLDRATTRPSFEFRLPELQPQLVGGGRLPRAPEPSRMEEGSGLQISLMKGDDGGGSVSKYDQTGMELLRGLRKLHIPQNVTPETALRHWIDAQRHPIAVAVRTGTLKMPDVTMVNDPFTRLFGWIESGIKGRPVDELFEEGKKNFTFSRIMSNFVSLALGRPAEFDATPMPFKMANGRFAQVIGAGIFLKIRDTHYALGIFTQVEGAMRAGEVPDAPGGRSVPPPAVVARITATARADAPGASHFRKALDAFKNNGDPDKSGE